MKACAAIAIPLASVSPLSTRSVTRSASRTSSLGERACASGTPDSGRPGARGKWLASRSRCLTGAPFVVAQDGDVIILEEEGHPLRQIRRVAVGGDRQADPGPPSGVLRPGEIKPARVGESF